MNNVFLVHAKWPISLKLAAWIRRNPGRSQCAVSTVPLVQKGTGELNTGGGFVMDSYLIHEEIVVPWNPELTPIGHWHNADSTIVMIR